MRLPKNRIARVALYLLSFTIIAIAIDLLLMTIYARVHPGPDTTLLTAPTLPDGRIDYLPAIDAPFAAGLTRDDNALVPFLETVGIDRFPESIRTPLTTSLHLTPAPERYVELDDFAKTQPTPPDPATLDTYPLMDHPWQATDHPLVVPWLARNAPALDRLHDASLRPRYYYPYPAMPRPDLLAMGFLPDLNPLRGVANTFLVRAQLRATSHDFPGSVEDLLTAYRFAALVGQSPFGAGRMIEGYIDASASRAARALAPVLPPDQLRALTAAIDALPPLPPVAPVIDRAERYIHLDALQYVARRNPHQAVRTLVNLVWPPSHADDERLMLRCCFPIDFDAHLRASNAFIDRFVAAAARPTYPARRAALDQWDASYASLPLLLRTNAFFGRSRIDWMTHPLTLRDAAAAQRALTRTALALAAHKLSTGHYPDTLAELKLDATTDPYTLKPFPYYPTPAGYTLTSAGPNMTDDAGKSDDLDASLPLQPPTSH